MVCIVDLKMFTCGYFVPLSVGVAGFDCVISALILGGIRHKPLGLGGLCDCSLIVRASAMGFGRGRTPWGSDPALANPARCNPGRFMRWQFDSAGIGDGLRMGTDPMGVRPRSS